ncbi:transcriptional regulator, AraC family [Agrilactobacillus composti DSM 18527 = JCM 14202]|nr:AraC family transcriptional regulator [Agrilactobacillus composti]GAF38624.1 transcriptional regulator, AraC family [Agrilactobacillus composti DSM 18527 = JCM 14202]
MRISFQKPAQQLPLYCESIGYHWPQTAVKRPHGYYAFHWLQTESGSGLVTVDQHQVKLAPHQGILICTNVPHAYHPVGNQEWKTAFLAFSGPIVANLMSFLELRNFIYFDKLNPTVDTFISQAYDYFLQDNILDTIDQSAVIYRFIMDIKQNHYLGTNQFVDQDIITPILSYLTQNFEHRITNEQLAQVTGYSIPYQNRIFFKKYGQSPLQYLADYRLRKAKVLLTLHADLQIQEIGNMVGFSDISRFIYQFKKRYHLTPNQFRKLM